MDPCQRARCLPYHRSTGWHIVKKACNAGLFDVAESSADACHDRDYLSLSLSALFGKPEYWEIADEGFLQRSEARLRAGRDNDYGWRSEALGYLGARRLFLGDHEGARRSWETAKKVPELDEAIRLSLLKVADRSAASVTAQIELSEVIRTSTERAWFLSQLSEFVD